MQTGNIRCTQNTVGRLFSKGGSLHLVLEVDAETGYARASCRIGDEPQVVEMPISEVIDRLSSSSKLRLDGLSSEETEERVVEKDKGWFFLAREGEHGPFADEATAKRELKRHILAAQEEGRTGRPAQAAAR